ncbi:hypothetical protein GQ61_00375 [Candidatus Nucleicultrix amoebiphila FS5]|jgi:hypothetical protein|uniref:Uncharacterized protein n=1 Tax=Candidatus Nucleicultrix amoebiphila FS5 TaxID=1414854 RepID=A0A1W6N2G8_9PROT|nr:hypothetical protein GQ61_00375 [Candidatus Nucleicultrix amoebiphila FS5]
MKNDIKCLFRGDINNDIVTNNYSLSKEGRDDKERECLLSQCLKISGLCESFPVKGAFWFYIF